MGGENAFKSRDIDFMEASISAKSSYSWRSILWAKDYLCQGLLWCIGYDMDASAIQRIPLGTLDIEDFPRWPFTKNGDSSLEPLTHSWKKLWYMQIAPKVKNFCRRMLSNALPCYENLIKR